MLGLSSDWRLNEGGKMMGKEGRKGGREGGTYRGSSG